MAGNPGLREALVGQILEMLGDAGDWVNHDTLMDALEWPVDEEHTLIDVLNTAAGRGLIRKKKGKRGILYGLPAVVQEEQVSVQSRGGWRK